jgi:hypothetical protein
VSDRGSISDGKRFRVLKRCGFKCVYCGRSAGEVTLHIDHARSVADGGTDDERNLVAACQGCNGGKSSMSVDVAAVANQSVRQESPPARATVPHPDCCPDCKYADDALELYAAYREERSSPGYHKAWYRCRHHHHWFTSWSDCMRLPPHELVEVLEGVA